MKTHSKRCSSCLTVPLGSAEGGMGPKWSLGTVTMMRPLAALALPLRTALQDIEAPSAPPLLQLRAGGSRPSADPVRQRAAA